MSNWAQDQAAFMRASGQQAYIGVADHDQAMLYADLIREEVNEELLPHVAEARDTALLPEQVAKLADDAIDTIYVCLGLLHSLGVDPHAAWEEVHGSNMAKIDPATGVVIKRADGKVQKPEGWTPPDMERVVRESWGL